jgi:DNA adenine methylase
MRKIFARYPMETTDIQYIVGGGKGSAANELLIFSWDVKAEPAGLF